MKKSTAKTSRRKGRAFAGAAPPFTKKTAKKAARKK